MKDYCLTFIPIFYCRFNEQRIYFISFLSPFPPRVFLPPFLSFSRSIDRAQKPVASSPLRKIGTKSMVSLLKSE
ncbi:hypothetical protein I3842_01G033800 [Carya illinoinensis]|uniref:Uncharacterized protein n=1 Tax=Carya illinoinensis TaxID=32201 RepID=A0A922G163_CARIL|nr:hypothetical protein I3842_01G033800 [Carya illinoinensis]